MRNQLCILLALSLMGLAGTQQAHSAYFDPNFPDQEPPIEGPDTQVPFWQWGNKIEATKQHIEKLQTELAKLPELQANKQLRSFGYHSNTITARKEELPEEPLWQIYFKRRYTHQEISLALIPAADHRSYIKQYGYGFPKRFSIDQLANNAPPVTIVDWRDKDFPDPGRLPVVFDIPDNDASWFRLNVYRGAVDQGFEYFALAEWICIVHDEFASTEEAISSSSYQSPPYWSESNLHDGRLGLGLPVYKKNPQQSDLIFESKELAGSQLKIRIDLGNEQTIPWTSLFPARSPGDISIPGYGFPRNIEIHVSKELRNGKLHKPELYYKSQEQIDPGNDWLRIRGEVFTNNRWVEFTFRDFPEYDGMPTFALGDISIDHRDINHAYKRPITIVEGPDALTNDLKLLVDNKVSGRKLVDRIIWLQGLAARKPLERELALYQESLEYQTTRQKLWIRRSIISALLMMAATAILVILNAKRARRRETLELRNQISRDLHDDLGSKMATISLTSEYITSQTQHPGILEGSDTILTMTDEMTTSLRDILWLTDTHSDTLPELIRRLADIAKMMVSSDVLNIKIPNLQDTPRKNVHLHDKREIIYFAREALNNAIKHADAKRIALYIEATRKSLIIRIQDDGKGFNLISEDEVNNDPKRHYGLMTMKHRAHNLKANCKIKSHPNKGTHIELTIPLKRFR